MRHKRILKGIVAFFLVFSCIFSICIPASAFFDVDDEDSVFLSRYNWDSSLLEADTWEVSRSGNTYTATRDSIYTLNYYEDMLFTTKTHLDIKEYSGGASIAAVARAQAQEAAESPSYGPYGTTEKQHNNQCRYNTWYYGSAVSGDAYPWCCVFVMWCANQCGYIESGLFMRTAGCTPLYYYFVNDCGFEVYNMSSCSPWGGGYTPVPGDLLFYYSQSESSSYRTVYEHIAIVVEVTDSTIIIVEGNGGDTVREQAYDYGDMMGQTRLRYGRIVHVEYPESEGETGIFEFLTGYMGLNPAAACGVLANIKQESNFDPSAVGDYGTSFGICQWHNERGTAMKNYCANMGLDWTSLDGQLHYLYYELSHSYPGVLSYLRGVSNSETGAKNAAEYWCRYYEVPANMSDRVKERRSLASNYWSLYGGS